MNMALKYTLNETLAAKRATTVCDKRKTCLNCPDRFINEDGTTCRSSCEGWAMREAQKERRYKRNAEYAVLSEPSAWCVRNMKQSVLRNRTGWTIKHRRK